MKKALLLGAVFLAAQISVYAKDCEQTVEGNDQLQYNVKEIKVPADCTVLKLTLKHVGKTPKSAMGHNIVIAETKDMNAITAEGSKTGLAKDYLNLADKKILASTKLIGGGETATVSVALSKFKKGGDYSFFCTFPGHLVLMKGKFVY